VDQLNRLPEYGVTDRAALDALLDSQWVGVLSTVADGRPATPEEADADPGVWSGLVPVRTVLDRAVPAPWSADLPVPPSVRRLTD
jgi:hypothetical protein